MKQEPVEKIALVDATSEDYQYKLASVLNWYSSECDSKDARKFLQEFAAANAIEGVLSVSDAEIRKTMAWLARVMTKGGSLSFKHKDDCITYCTRVFSPAPDVEPVAVVPRMTIQEALNAKIDAYIGELEGVMDAAMHDKAFSFSLIADLRAKEMPVQTAAGVTDWATKKIQEYLYVTQTTDDDIKEGYSNLTKVEIVRMIRLLDSMVSDCEKFGEFKKANRKPRKKRVIPPAQQCKSLKYLPKHDELGLQSQSPLDMVGASQVWLYNVKTKKLSVYRTESAMGIQVKGTSLQNYEPELSTQKTLRKPQEQLKALMAAGKVQLRKFMDSIKTKEQACNGRVNQDTIIVRAIK